MLIDGRFTSNSYEFYPGEVFSMLKVMPQLQDLIPTPTGTTQEKQALGWIRLKASGSWLNFVISWYSIVNWFGTQQVVP